MRPDELRYALSAIAWKTIVCAQVGNVDTGAFDPVGRIADACTRQAAWLHVDGAFGLWAAATQSTPADLTTGIERADSWAVDAHKWLNVPYDSAMAIVSDPDAHAAAMGLAVCTSSPTLASATEPITCRRSPRRARAVPICGREVVGP